MKKKILFLVGPTAVGKSAVAVSLARKANAEIISCDSMQIYKGMDILTSAPSSVERRRVAHHLVGEISPGRSYDVSQYRRAALAALRDIHRRGKVPLFVGGTGLYMSIVIDGIFTEKAQDMALRNRLAEEARTSGSAAIYGRLKACDPTAAAKIHPNDAKRIIRALEVFACTGKPISELQKRRKGLEAAYDISIFCLTMDRDSLNVRIDTRVEEMFKQGLTTEVAKLLRKDLSRTASCAIGIRELKGYFDKEYDLEEAQRLMKRNTRLYAKRQLTWFRKDKRIRWIDVREGQTPAQIANKLWKEHSSLP